MNVVDILIMITLCIGTILGFYHGLVRTAFHTIVLYGATIVAAFAYPAVAKWIGYVVPGSSPQLRQAVAFLLPLLLLFNLIALSTRASFKRHSPFLPALLDKLGGMAAGFFLTSLWIGICLVLADFLLSVSWVKWQPLRDSIDHLVATSEFAHLMRGLLPYALDALRPWFAPFGGLPGLFVIR